MTTSRPTVTFEYTGTGVLRVTGLVTGVSYTFNGAGARLSVDVRDKNDLLHVPRLRVRS